MVMRKLTMFNATGLQREQRILGSYQVRRMHPRL